MDIIGNEVTQRIRAAITNKLKDVGVYVDDELPDYILVMVANKKSREQMMSDLMLFLGTSTESFTKWLHELLDNLQATTSVDQPKIPPLAIEEAKEKEEAVLPPEPGPPSPKEKVEEIPSPFATVIEEDNEEVLTFQTEVETDDILMHELRKEEDAEMIQSELKASSKILLKTSPPPVALEKIPITIASKTSAKVRPIFHRRNTPQSEVHRPLKSYKPYFSRNVDEEDEKYDPRNPAVGTVASIVRVTERKSSVPKALQANKLLLFKAMDDANKSVSFSQRKTQAVHIEPYEPTPISMLSKPTLKVHSQVVPDEPKASIELELEEEGEIEETEMIMQNEVEEVQMAPAEDPPEILIPVTSSKIPLMPLKRKITNEAVAKAENTSVPRNPRFVVTLDGVDPREFLSPKSLRSVVSQKPITDLGGLGEEQDMEEQDYLEEQDMPYTEQEEFYSEEQLMEEAEEEPAKRLKVAVRCRKWPACRNGDACKFHHPTQHCKMFPKCTYGKKCLYIHPNCKYDSICAKEDCPFTHASRKSQSQTLPIPICVASEIIPITSTAVCKFHPDCLNPNCTFYHPMPCRYGQYCKNASCHFTHPMPSVASPHQLKWTAPRSLSSRKFSATASVEHMPVHIQK